MLFFFPSVQNCSARWSLMLRRMYLESMPSSSVLLIETKSHANNIFLARKHRALGHPPGLPRLKVQDRPQSGPALRKSRKTSLRVSSLEDLVEFGPSVY